MTDMPLQPHENNAVMTRTPRDEVVEVAAAVGAEARDLGHVLEQGAEQQQPDHRLDDRHEDEPRLADEGAQVALGLVHGLGDGGHRAISMASGRKARPVWLR